jgi:DsbC/DsbD-like thiol-disulfide interchange protein
MTRFALILLAASAFAGEWSAPVHVMHDMQPCVTYRAKTDGDLLVIEAKLQPGWHTFTIDNEKRAEEKRAGKPSLGIDQPTRFTLTGLELAGPWYQSTPKDFSKPKLRWYSWGFEQEVTFAAKVRRTASAATVGVRGQACTDSTCKNIDVSLPVPASDETGKTSSLDLKTLIEVR